jgi:MFS family permease
LVVSANEEALLAADHRIAPSWKSALAAMITLSAGPSVFLVMCFAVYTPALRAEFGWNIGDVAIAAMLGSLCVAVISPIQGRLCDRLGSRIVVLWSFPLFGLSLIGLSQINGDIRWFYVGYVLATLLALGVWPLSFMRCVSTWFDRRLGLALGVVNVGPGLGGTLAPLLVGALIAGFGWRTAFIVCGLIVVCVAWPIAFVWLRERPVVSALGDRIAH